MSDGTERRPFDQLSPTMRFGIAVLGLVVGLLLIFVGARSCEDSLGDPAPTPTSVTPTGAAN